MKDRLLGCMGQVLQQGVDRIGEVGDRASEGQATGVYGAGFTAGSLARKRARGKMRETGNKVSSDKELTDVGRMAEVTEGGREEHCEWRDQIRGCDDFL